MTSVSGFFLPKSSCQFWLRSLESPRPQYQQITGKQSTMPTPELTAFEQLEAKFIEFVILHTPGFDEAAEYLSMTVTPLRDRRDKYRIPKPPPNHYDGPKLTH